MGQSELGSKGPIIVLLALLASSTNALQARVNGAASLEVGNPIVAAMMSVSGGFVIASALVILNRKTRSKLLRILSGKEPSSLQPWNFFAGVGGGVFIFGQSLVVPQFGVALYIIAVVAGQTMASLLVDKYGLGPAGKKAITALRIAAAIVATAGVAVSAIGRESFSAAIIPALLFGFMAGAMTAVQYGLNGKLAIYFESRNTTSALNFLMGFSFLSVLLLISGWLGIWPRAAPASILEFPELWAGGALGFIFIASAAYFVGKLGVLRFAIVSVLGQLLGALALDLVAPTEGTVLTIFVFIGLTITLLGALLSAVKPR